MENTADVSCEKGLVPADLRPLYNLSRSLIKRRKWEHLCGFVEPVESEHSSCVKAVICTFSHVQKQQHGTLNDAAYAIMAGFQKHRDSVPNWWFA